MVLLYEFGMHTHTVVLSYLLNAALKVLMNICIFGHLIKISVTSYEEIKCKCELGEGTFGHALYCSLVIHH